MHVITKKTSLWHEIHDLGGICLGVKRLVSMLTFVCYIVCKEFIFRLQWNQFSSGDQGMRWQYKPASVCGRCRESPTRKGVVWPTDTWPICKRDPPWRHYPDYKRRWSGLTVDARLILCFIRCPAVKAGICRLTMASKLCPVAPAGGGRDIVQAPVTQWCQVWPLPPPAKVNSGSAAPLSSKAVYPVFLAPTWL